MVVALGQEELLKMGFSIENLRPAYEPFDLQYVIDPRCEGYCQHEGMRRTALTAALDALHVRHPTGQTLFNDYNAEGFPTMIGVRGGRGITVAFYIREPVITDVVVVCCCYNLAYHLMECRRAM